MARPAVVRAQTIGTARVGRRTKDLTQRLQPGDIAVIDHADLDRVAAEALVAARVGGVVNAAASITGRYPNVGPLLIVAAGIPLIDGAGSAALDAIAEGSVITLEDGQIRCQGSVVAEGVVQTMESLDASVESSKATIGLELTRFAENTLEYMRAEQYLLLESPPVPDLDVKVAGRHVLIVVRGDQFKEDLAALNAYIRDLRPVIFAVDGGADAVLKAGHKPDVILGDFDSVSREALRCGAQLIVHAYANGTAPGAVRLTEEGVPHTTFSLAGTSEDVAMLLAYEKGAELIVAVGTHVSLVDFLDKGRPGMASTFLTRLKVGPILVDAKGVNQLYQSRARKRDITLLVVAAMMVLLLVIALSPPFRVFWQSISIRFREWRR